MNKKRLSSTQILAMGFALLILLGAALLSLPVSNRDGQWLSYFDSLFTATSATCVTGLSLFDTWTQFSALGQVVIIVLIQIGGLGFITFAMLLSLLLGKRIGLKERTLLSESISVNQIGGIVRIIRRVLTGTLIIESAGAALLAIRFVPLLGWGEGLWFSIFHSISAFCNAGFDIMGRFAPGTSMAYFVDDPLVCVTITLLILIGGIGFLVWNDIAEHGLRFREYKLHTRVAFIASLVLVVAGTALLYALESNGVMAGKTVGQKLTCALFQAVVPRTAGFFTVDVNAMCGASKLVTILLMFIGASPGSTGGGAKTTTVIVAAAAMAAHFKRYEDVSVGRMRIKPEVVRQALCNVTIYIATTFMAITILCIQGVDIVGATFECVSALSTVGSSLGVTATLPPLSRTIIILLMYMGRVGSLTVFMAVAQRRKTDRLRYPAGDIIVG